ncbi:MAG TPA: hypothetical protein VLZ50_08745 [Terracidiphilus sp.]|nr:hypothetical protein [Terracidiphilus sp.]
MPFSISFLGAPLEYPFDDQSTPAAWGRIVLGDFVEDFLSTLYSWTTSEYEAQWRSAIDTILKGGDRSALIVEYLPADVGTHLRWWPMYRIHDAVFVQNHILFYEQLERPFSIEHPEDFIKDRQTQSEDGVSVSEWSVLIADLAAFAEAFAR